MERRKLGSGHLKSAGYDERNRLLEIEFANGTIVQYSGDTPEYCTIVPLANSISRRRFLSPSPAHFSWPEPSLRRSIVLNHLTQCLGETAQPEAT